MMLLTCFCVCVGACNSVSPLKSEGTESLSHHSQKMAEFLFWLSRTTCENKKKKCYWKSFLKDIKTYLLKLKLKCA